MKKAKQGFTLIELLAVIFIIGIISVIAIPAINKVTKQSREELYQIQISNIKGGAKNWGASNIAILPEVDGEVITLTLGQLKMGDFIDMDIKDPRTRKLFPNDMEITITRVRNNYEYKVIEGTGSDVGELDLNSPSITLNGLAHETIEIHTEYIDKGVIARDPSGAAIDEIDIKIRSNNNIVETIDTSILRQYKITYSVNYNGITASSIRTITVKDTIPPILTIAGNIELSTKKVSTFDFMEGVNSSDNSLKEPTITTSGTISTLPGTYYINYTATDESGNKITKVRSITVKDESAPVITILGDNPLNINVGQIYTDMGATAIDSIEGDITNKIITTGTVNIDIPGTHTITYSVTNNQGKESIKIREVNVIDNVPPTITFGTNGNSTYAKTRSTTVTVNDVHGTVSSRHYQWTTSTTAPTSGSFTTTFANGSTLDTPAGESGGYYLWIKAVDNSGNEKILGSNVFNLDNTNPVIASVESNATNVEFDSFTITRTGNATDAHSGLATNPYIYQTSTNGTNWTTKCTNNTTTCNATGLSEDTTYYYRICANDKAGNQSCIANKTVKTKPPRDAEPSL